MDVRKNSLIILISLAIGGLITYWLYTKYHILFFVVFIPIIGFSGGLISRIFRQMKNYNRQKDWYRPGDNFKDFEEGFPSEGGFPSEEGFLPDEGFPASDKTHRGSRKNRKLLQQSGYLPPYDDSPDDR